MNLGKGHGGLWLDVDWSSINSWGGAVGTPASVVAHVAVVVGQPSPKVADRDPLAHALLLWEQLLGGSGGAAFIDCGKVISVHPDGAMVMKISPHKSNEWVYCP